MKEGLKTTAGEDGAQLPESNGTFVSTARPDHCQKARRKHDVTLVVMRVASVLSSVAAVCLMVTAKEGSTMSIFGFSLPIYSNWSYSDSFEYLVGVCAAVAAHSVLQLLISTSRLLRKSPVIHSRKHAWLIFVGDQAFAYALMSAGSAASGVTNLNRTGIRHSALPNFCKPLRSFCDRVAVSIAFTFVSCFLLAASAVFDVIWLSSY
ncbi:CASP-like protein 3A1 [Rhododendron vialii]|uniref:CASP-like protein 3A1 n=1 Tax=Rhododendron vialii TaxID=182163 RepID=UPI00265EBA45|nr:CASP-like protein 3A1 [Rhododendron vialii]